MKRKRKFDKAKLGEGTSDPSDLPEFLHIALEEEDDEECACAVCMGDDDSLVLITLVPLHVWA